jgi:hypothetical protein
MTKFELFQITADMPSSLQTNILAQTDTTQATLTWAKQHVTWAEVELKSACLHAFQFQTSTKIGMWVLQNCQNALGNCERLFPKHLILCKLSMYATQHDTYIHMYT